MTPESEEQKTDKTEEQKQPDNGNSEQIQELVNKTCMIFYDTKMIFGNPKVGTPLMQCQQSIALDLPQKALACGAVLQVCQVGNQERMPAVAPRVQGKDVDAVLL